MFAIGGLSVLITRICNFQLVNYLFDELCIALVLVLIVSLLKLVVEFYYPDWWAFSFHCFDTLQIVTIGCLILADDVGVNACGWCLIGCNGYCSYVFDILLLLHTVGVVVCQLSCDPVAYFDVDVLFAVLRVEFFDFISCYSVTHSGALCSNFENYVAGLTRFAVYSPQGALSSRCWCVWVADMLALIVGYQVECLVAAVVCACLSLLVVLFYTCIDRCLLGVVMGLLLMVFRGSVSVVRCGDGWLPAAADCDALVLMLLQKGVNVFAFVETMFYYEIYL
eukprot:gene3310-2292_t